MSRSPSSSPARSPRPGERLPGRPGAAPRRALAVLTLFITVAAGACGDGPADPRFRQPALHFDGQAWGRLLSLASALEGTPLGDAARRALAAAEGCPTVFGVARAGDDTGAAPPIACLDAADAADATHVAWAETRRGDADGWLTWPLGPDGHVELRFDVDASGSVALSGRVAPPTGRSALDLLWPDGDAPAASILDPSRLLVHARARPAGGLGLTRFLPDGGQADALFGLKGRLLEGALLAGTWELAFVTASDDGTRPLPVVALHHRGPEPIRAALDEALSQLEATWPIERSARTFELADGARVSGGCYADLPLLPELSPCWAVTDGAVVIAYRAAALDAAIGRPHGATAPDAAVGRPHVATGPDPETARGTRVVADFARLDRLDRRARAAGGGTSDLVTPAASHRAGRTRAPRERRTTRSPSPPALDRATP